MNDHSASQPTSGQQLGAVENLRPEGDSAETSCGSACSKSVHNLTAKAKINCWQFKRCGREPGGSKVSELGLCPAASEVDRDGVNCGMNGGRYCWRVAGTFCKGVTQGSYAKKVLDCVKCDFFKLVQEQESITFRH